MADDYSSNGSSLDRTPSQNPDELLSVDTLAPDADLSSVPALDAEEAALEEDSDSAWHNGVGSTMRETGGTILAGFTALRDVRRAAKSADEAKDEVERMQEALEADRMELARRAEIDHDYPQIVSRETTELESARAAAEEARSGAARVQAQHDELKVELEKMSAEHEERISPYRNIMESTKSRADDASRALADARRNTKNAESQKNSAEKQRDQRITQARRAYESAQERLRRSEAELSRLQAQPDASMSALGKLQNEVVTERAHADAARAEIETVTSKETANVEALQERLWQQKQALEDAEREAGAAKEEANARKDEYDRLYKQAMAEENKLKEQMDALERDLSAAKNAEQKAEERAAKAQATLDEAEDIHSNPQVSAALQQHITAAQAELSTRTAEADELSGRVRELRQSTRGQRIAAIAVLAAVVAVLVLILWLVFSNR